jgi:hypothetical protein
MDQSRIIEITPDLERRITEDRRRAPRERMADLERRLQQIADMTGPPYGPPLPGVTDLLKRVYKIATGETKA